MDSLKASCDAKKEEDDWEGVPDKFKKYSQAVSLTLRN
jgi:hypothetical protein